MYCFGDIDSAFRVECERSLGRLCVCMRVIDLSSCVVVVVLFEVVHGVETLGPLFLRSIENTANDGAISSALF